MSNKYYGYVYLTTNLLTNKYYVGKKAYTHKVKKKLTKKELSLITTKGRKPVYKYVEVDSGYKDYYGSSAELQADIKKYGKENFTVEVIQECETKKKLAYYELYYMFLWDVLRENTYNKNIGGRFFRKDLE